MGGLSASGKARLDFSLRFVPGAQAPVAQRIEHLTTDQKVGSSNLSGRAKHCSETTQLLRESLSCGNWHTERRT